MAERRPVLLTVSGRIPSDLGEQVVSGRRPRADYVEMATAFDADLVDVDIALEFRPRLGRALNRIFGVGVLLAWHCFRERNRRRVIVTDGEQVGIPLALIGKVLGRGSARHMMIVHVLSTAKKARVVRFAMIQSLIDRYVVYCREQQRFINQELGVPPERIILSTFMVDTAFFAPGRAPTERHLMICSAGLERRDYDTFIDAVTGLDVKVVIAAASPWSRRGDTTADQSLPPNVEIRRLSQFDLRTLYAESRLVVMPLEPVDFQAGITAILEAMSMERAVVVTRTVGQTDTVIDNVTGLYVESNDVEGLRLAIVRLLDDAAGAEELGRAARRWTVENADVERYADRLAAEVRLLGATALH